MIKVSVHPLTSRVSGLSSALLLAPLVAGCAVESAPDTEAGEDGAEALTSAGTSTFELTRVYWDSSRPQFQWNTQNSVDEFLRVGAKVTVRFPMHFAWEVLNPEGGEMASAGELRKYGVTLRVLFLDQGKQVGYRDLGKVQSYSGTENYDLAANFRSFTIPKRTDSLGFELVVTNPARKSAKVETAAFAPVPVFGGDAPNKTLVFDNDNGALRQRVVEGEKLVAGSTAHFVYSDWRADQVVDKNQLNRQIGVAQGAGRFGYYDMSIFGDLVYEISCGVAFDDGKGFQAETQFTANADARTVYGQYGRTMYEADVAIPKGVTKLSTYCHVKAYLVVNYSRYGQIKQKWYEDGARILLSERWDNLGGTSGQNYELPVSAK